MRTRSLVIVGAAVIAAAAAVPITLSAVLAPSAFAQVKQAVARTAALSYQASATSTLVEAPGAKAQPPKTVTGEFDLTRGLAEEASSQGIQFLYVGGFLYTPLTRAAHALVDTDGAPLFPAGKSWLRFSTAPWRPDTPGEAAALASLGVAAGPSKPDPLSLLESATQVREMGRASGPGWTGTEYAFTGRVKLIGQSQPERISGTVEVDRQGRVRQLDATESDTPRPEKVAITFGDFGLRVVVKAPPAGETITL